MGEKPHSRASRSGRRALSNYVGLGRTVAQSHLRMVFDNLPPGIRPPAQSFDGSEAWPWIKSWLEATYRTDFESVFVAADKKHAFEPYPETGERGHYDLSSMRAADGSLRIALAGDWGTGTDEAQSIADSMVRGKPQLTIHLGDIYYVGLDDEIQENCMGRDTTNYKGVSWRHGSNGSFSLNGNHEMYSGGNGYFNTFLPSLGIPDSQDKQQLRSYFCLETPQWRILAIDTGYNADTLSGNCKLDDHLIAWLKTVIDPLKNRKPTVLLSHHQWFSDFGDGAYDTPANQMAEFLRGQEIVWLSGHEHRLSIYNSYQGSNGLSAYFRCIGHGGMPVVTGDPISNDHKVEYYDADPARTQLLSDGTVVGLNGYVQMVIEDAALTLEYFDINNLSLLKESFQAAAGGEEWNGILSRTVVSDPGILRHLTYEAS